MGRFGLLAVLCLAPIFVRAATEIVRVSPFATADSVRVVTRLAGETGGGPLVLSGEIVGWKTGESLWSGDLGQAEASAGMVEAERTVAGLHPRLWAPGSPSLYLLTVTVRRQGKVVATATTRFGFRTIEVRQGQFFLNGHPLFLRGLAINPPDRTIPDAVGMSPQFANDYVRFMRSRNFNLIRMTLAFRPGQGQAWFDACDEQGMLVFQGNYGRPPGAVDERTPPRDFDRALAAYQAVFQEFVPHPSIIITILANELPNPTGSTAGWHAFLTRASERLKAWDPTRLIIGNAGYGLGLEGDIDDIHRYWGWYYNSFLTYYNLRDAGLFGDPRLMQPETFSECVGSFTGPTGEFNVVASKQLLAQQQWTGTSGRQRDDALAYQAFMVKQAAESFRRMREINPRLSGLMPFTILFYNWNGVTSFQQMGPKPAAEQLGVAYQPVLLSWELWTPQVYAGAHLRAVAHVINDAEDNSELAGAELKYQVQDRDGRVIAEGRRALPPLPYYGTWHADCAIDVPTEAPTGDYRLLGTVSVAGKVVSHNDAPLFMAGKEWRHPVAATRRLKLFDPTGRTAAALTSLGVEFDRVTDFSHLGGEGAVLVIGEGAWSPAVDAPARDLPAFVAGGGRVLCLGQRFDQFKGEWLPAPIHLCETSANDQTYLGRKRPTFDQMNINPERPDHPVFAGVERARLRLWSDYTGWDQSHAGFPRVYPVAYGFTLTRSESLEHTAILADYDRGLEGVALCEMFSGRGSVILSAFDLVNRIGLDPVADRLLGNLLGYAAGEGGHEVHPAISGPIRWGDYPTQQGIVLGPLSGLFLGASWVPPPTNPGARPQRLGSWNMMPGDQMVPRGVRAPRALCLRNLQHRDGPGRGQSGGVGLFSGPHCLRARERS